MKRTKSMSKQILKSLQNLPSNKFLFYGLSVSAILNAGNVAYANPIDIFGIGARSIGMGNAFTAVADDPFASYYNVGGLSQIKRTTVNVSTHMGFTFLGDKSNCVNADSKVGCSEPFYYRSSGNLTEQQVTYGYDAPAGLGIGLALPILKKFTFGLSMYLPIGFKYQFKEDPSIEGALSGINVRLMRAQISDPNLPDYIMYQNRPQRFSAYTGLAFEIIPGLGVGVGTSMLTNANIVMKVNANVNVVQGTEDTSDDDETRISTELVANTAVEAIPNITPVAGIFWNLGTVSQSLQSWQLGLTYRGSTQLNGEIEVDADVGVGIDLQDSDDVTSTGMTLEDIKLSMIDFFTPQQVAFGVSGVIADRIRLAGDVTWYDWSAYKLSAVSVGDLSSIPLGLEIDMVENRLLPEDSIKDVIVPRFGIEGRLGPYLNSSKLKGVEIFLRGGASFEKNPFGAQTSTLNLLNSDKIIGNLGLGILTHNPFSKSKDLPIAIDMGFQYHGLLETTHTKDIYQGSAPPDGTPINGSYISKGSVVQGVMSLQLGF